jgi:hypothetical protein
VSLRPGPETYLSGESGHVAGVRLGVTRTLQDLALEALAGVTGTGARLDRLAARAPARSVLVLSAYRPGRRLAQALPALSSAHHRVRFALAAAGAPEPALAEHTVAENLDGGKFQNLNRALEGAGPADWTLVVDDDVVLGERFLDRFIGVCEAASLQLAQPAQSRRSHAAWRVTRRRALSLVRRTSFVEIGPVTAFAAAPARELLPFPDLRFGWGLDLHWAAVAERRGWARGVVDATPVRHEDAPIGTAYGHDEAIEEAGRFLAGREYLSSAWAQRTLSTLRRLP